jgi:hypothetical protein
VITTFENAEHRLAELEQQAKARPASVQLASIAAEYADDDDHQDDDEETT